MKNDQTGSGRSLRRRGVAQFGVGCIASVGLTTILFLTMPAPSAAQQDFSKVEIRAIDLGAGLAMLRGAGGNLAVSTGPDGVFLVDDQYAPLTGKIRAAIAALSGEPIRFVLNTHWHGDHTGGNENLGREGVLIMAHHQVRERLSTDQVQPLRGRTTRASKKPAWPIITFEDGVTVHLNGQTIEVTHVEPAHTDGDSIVYFREADVLHMGDAFFSGLYPFIDTASGGRIDGMIAAVDRGLAIGGRRTRIIPGHGPLARRADLIATRAMLLSIRGRVQNLIDEGLNRAQVVAKKPSKNYDAAYGGGFMKPDAFVGIVFDSLAKQ
jgi:cyclase